MHRQRIRKREPQSDPQNNLNNEFIEQNLNLLLMPCHRPSQLILKLLLKTSLMHIISSFLLLMKRKKKKRSSRINILVTRTRGTFLGGEGEYVFNNNDSEESQEKDVEEEEEEESEGKSESDDASDASDDENEENQHSSYHHPNIFITYLKMLLMSI